jgi:hypothetical protein
MRNPKLASFKAECRSHGIVLACVLLLEVKCLFDEVNMARFSEKPMLIGVNFKAIQVIGEGDEIGVVVVCFASHRRWEKVLLISFI